MNNKLARTSIVSLYNTIKQDIVTGELAAGGKLKLSELKERYNTSVNTVREVLSRLSSEGLVDAVDQKGFSVTPCSENALNELRHMRMLLEAEGLRLSLKNANVEWEAGIVAAHYKLTQVEQAMEKDEKKNFQLWCQYDYEFHRSLIAACDSELLIEKHKEIFDRFHRYFLQNIRINGFKKQQISSDHEELLDAALQKNDKAFTKVLSVHLENLAIY